MVKRLLALATLLAVPVWAGSIPEDTLEEIRDRLAPFGSSCLEGDEACGSVSAASPVVEAAVSQEPRSGQEVYDRFCFACHATAVAQAPLFQDAEQWAPRLEKGMDELLRTSNAGLGAMPPKGTCMDCSDVEMVSAIRYMSAAE
ncbi:MAG: c-type cytochrome [Gammaproteobacteria bacterium]|nr:c-type cytochrome [Gammaproteobacteria bacterium]